MDEYHVVLVGRAGDHPGTNIYLVGPGSRKNAIHTGETIFRKETKLATNVAIRCSVAHSGTEESGVQYIDRLVTLMEERREE